MPSFPYVIVNAFTRSPFGGNPAAIVLLPPDTFSTQIVDASTMGAISKSFSQPITVFIAPPSDGEDENAFGIRFFVQDKAVPLCGHGTLAAAKAIYAGLFQGLCARHLGTPLRFTTSAGLTICASAVSRSTGDEDDTLYEIELPANPAKPLYGPERDRVHEAVARALGQDPTSLNVRFVGRGTGSLDCYLMVVLDSDEVLDGRTIDPRALVDAGPFLISLSHPTPGKAQAFESRVFAPNFGLPEDQVCGTAHTLMVPYYAALPESRVAPGQEAFVRQVSPRGGDLWVTFDEKRGVVVFRGDAKLFARGDLIL